MRGFPRTKANTAPNEPRRPASLRAGLAAVLLSIAAVAMVQPQEPNDEQLAELFASFELRNVGPFRQGSWITALAAPEVDPLGPNRQHRHTYYAGARNGGVWKTINRGVTFANVTDAVGIAAVGSLAVSSSDPNTVWVGTGDAEVARSSYSGTGVWRSLDAGATWENRGLTDSHHVARIVIHPTDANTVWVASMGHLFSSNTERGVFRTRDDGETWEHVLDLGPEVGVIDMVIDEADPNRLWATAYDKVRLPWHLEAGGERSGIYATSDGGDSWRLQPNGMATGTLGRIGIDRFRNRRLKLSNPGPSPDVLYAIVENLNQRPPTEEEAVADRKAGKDPEPRPIGNQVYATRNGGERWLQVSPEDLAVGSKSAYAFNEIRVDPWDPNTLYVLSETLISSIDGGKSYRDVNWPMETLYSTIFGDVRSMWINPRDPEHILLGSDGGVFPSYDGGKTADHLLNLPLSEVYDIAVDDADPYNVYAGLQDHETWRAPINAWSGSVGVEDWVMVGRWDGMVSAVSPDGRWYYATTQFGNHLRVDLATGQRADIVPKAAAEEPEYRYTWTTPLEISPHDPDVIWTGSQKLLRSSDRGATWEERSPDLTDNDAEKIAGKGHVRYCTITTHAESHLTRGLVWAGTDDGRVWLTKDGGENWTETTQALTRAGAPRDRWTSRVVPSRHSAQRAYVAKSGYRRDDFEPYLYRTDDEGKSWRRIVGRGSHALPKAPISVVLEDPVNPDLLFAGTDLGVWASLDAGQRWFRFSEGLPTVPVRDLAIQEREADLAIGTYGRGAWVGDIRPLQAATKENLSKAVHLFEVESKPLNFTERDEWGAHELYGDAVVRIPNERDGLSINYWLSQDVAEATLRVVRTADGVQLGIFDAPSTGGLHRVPFPFPEPQDPKMLSHTDEGDTGEGRVGEEAAGPDDTDPDGVGPDDTAPRLEPGEVEIQLLTAGSTLRRRARLLPMPAQPITP